VHDQKKHEQRDKDEVKRARGLMTPNAVANMGNTEVTPRTTSQARSR